MASDHDQALARVKAAGFSTVELAPLPPGPTTDRLAESLVRHDLDVVSIHGDLPTHANIEPWTQSARECRCSRSSGMAGRVARDSIPSKECET